MWRSRLSTYTKCAYPKADGSRIRREGVAALYIPSIILFSHANDRRWAKRSNEQKSNDWLAYIAVPQQWLLDFLNNNAIHTFFSTRSFILHRHISYIYIQEASFEKNIIKLSGSSFSFGPVARGVIFEEDTESKWSKRKNDMRIMRSASFDSVKGFLRIKRGPVMRGEHNVLILQLMPRRTG